MTSVLTAWRRASPPACATSSARRATPTRCSLIALCVCSYDERIDRVEARITACLRDQLGTARNANEMFRIFSRFNALFVRPHIRGAIREYQTQLIQRVKDDIESLHEKFKVQYPHSKACRMSRVRDLPPVAGSIIWAKQASPQHQHQHALGVCKIFIDNTTRFV